ncbi:hypothetical protein BGW42_001784 [Actinomortierella wolfii]|nr:hypothetical protein BGW42_001784 [Actinomortierella wolfii]
MSIEGTATPPKSPQPAPDEAIDGESNMAKQQQHQPQEVSQHPLPHGSQPLRHDEGRNSAEYTEMKDAVQDTPDCDDETDMEDLGPASGNDGESGDATFYDAVLSEPDLQRVGMIPWNMAANKQAVRTGNDSGNIPEDEEEDVDDVEEEDYDNEDDDDDDQDEFEGEEGNLDDKTMGESPLGQGDWASVEQEAVGAAAIKRGLSSSTAGSSKATLKKDSRRKAKHRVPLDTWDSGLSPERELVVEQPPPASDWDEPLPSYAQTWEEVAACDQGWGEDDDNWKDTGHDDDNWGYASHGDDNWKGSSHNEDSWRDGFFPENSWDDTTGGAAIDTCAWNGSPSSSPTPLPPLSPSSAPSTPLSQRCEIITRLLRQGQFQQGFAHASLAVNQAIAYRKGELDEQPGEHFTENELRLMESAYCATWARTVMERRNGIHAMEPFLSSIIQLAILMVEQDRTIPDSYAQTVQALFHQGEFDSYRRTRRASRMLHAERVSYDDTMSNYGYEDQDLAHVQRNFQIIFQQLGGMEACLTAMESHLEDMERWDIKLRQLLSLLTLCSKIRLEGDNQKSRAVIAAEYSNRLTSIVLKYFPDQVDVLNVVDKAIVYDIVGQVSDFLLENSRVRSRSYEGIEDSEDDDDMSGPSEYHHHNHRRHSTSEIRAHMKVADFRLEMAARMMKCSRLDMRLAGLSELKEVLAPVLSRMQQQPRARVRRRSDGESYGIPELDKKSIENMCARLHDLQIVGYIFGPNIHLEIVQRSSEGNQHRSIVYGVYQVLSDLSDKLPLDYLLHLFQKLQAAPLEQWDQQLVDLTRALFQAVLQRVHQAKDGQSATLVPYLTLFNVLRQSAAHQRSKEDPVFTTSQPIANSVILSISSLLNEGLRLTLSAKDCKSLMDICINDLKTHHPGSVWSLQVIQVLFDHQGQTDEGLTLLSKLGPTLPDLFIADFQAFAESMKKVQTSFSPTTSSFSAISNYVFTQEQQRTMQLKARLDFLESMSKNFPDMWASTTIADKLWESLIVEPINAYDRDLTFRCLESITDHTFIMYIFEKLLPALDVRDLSEAAWSCIRQYFLQLNWNLKNLLVDVDQATGIHSYIVVQPLVGLDSIWSIALGARQPAPENKPNLPDGLPSFRQDLVRTCVEHLFDAADRLTTLSKDDAAASDLPLKFERCINILKAFLATCNVQARDQGDWPRIHGALDEDNMLTLKISASSPSATVTVSIHPSETLLNLKRQVAQRFNAVSVDGIRLFTMGRDISALHNNKTLEDLRVMNGQHFMVQLLRQQSVSMDHTKEAVTDSPTDWLLQEEVYSRILQCLHLDERFASQAWEIIVCLPTSPRLLQDIVELKEPIDWASFLEARSPFMLLYSLQIINALVRKDMGIEDPTKREWTARFIARGGLASLMSVIMSESGLGMASRTGQTEKKTLGLMLKVLVRLTQTATDLPQLSTDVNGSELLSKLVQEILRSASIDSGLERGATTSDFYKSLYSKIIDLLLTHRSIEDRPEKEDAVLIGLLQVATVMLDSEKYLKTEEITLKAVDHVFDECLFVKELSETSTSETHLAQCQSTASRTAALTFLEECATGSVSTLQHLMAKLHHQFHRGSDDALADEWAYNPKDIMRASCGFVGLQNLGATCYMNSLLQQFFMNRAFRKGLLSAPITVADGDEKFESILYQLQMMFGNLQESHRRSFNAYGFCYAYKDWDGNPTNVAIQMDVDEFFSILFDRLENQLKGTPQEQLLKNVYGGKLVQQIKSKDCEHISEREDSFFSIQCEVKNKRSVEESLELYVQGEILDGDNKYKCSGCDKHVDAIKRACIKELPQNLVLHLKRFDYDMDTMSRIKINDRFEFPTVLDMEPYTLDYLTRKEQAQEGGAPTTPVDASAPEPSKYEYNLVGVLVHTGTADSGHYYSYIKDRSHKGASDRGTWLHFNDSTVEEFDPSDIPAKAFGGTDYLPSESPYHKSPGRTVPKCYSAYMLFYERAHPSNEEDNDGSNDIFVPEDILEGVRHANSKLLKDVAIFDPLYYKFVWDLFNMHHQPDPTSAPGYGTGELMSKSADEFARSLVPMERLHLERLSLRYGVDFFFSVLIHARDTDQELRQWTAYLAELMGHDPQGCIDMLELLANDTRLLSNALISCKVGNVRQAVAQLIVACLGHLRRNEPALYGIREVESSSTTQSTGEGDTEPMMETRLVCEEGTAIYRFTNGLGELLGDARKNWQQFDEFFSLLHNIALLGKEERAMLIQQGLLTNLIEFFIGDERHDSKKKKMMDKFSKPSFHYVLLTIQELLLTCDVLRSMELITNAGNKTNRIRRSSSTSNRSTSSSGPSSSSQASPEDSSNLSDVDTNLPEGTVVFSSADLAAMIYVPPTTAAMSKDRAPVFFAKMIQDRTETEIVATIARHLSAFAPLGNRVLEFVSSCMDHVNEDHVQTVLQVYKELIQIDDDNTEARAEIILQRTVKVLSLSSSPTIAYDCLEFLRAISDFGQCGRFVQRWLLANKGAWVQEMLVVHSDQDTRAQSQQFLRELLSSERVFNPDWTDAQAAEAMSRHFQELLECMRIIPSILPYYQQQSPSDEEDGMWRFVEYFQALSDMVTSDVERTMFNPYWPTFIDCLAQIDARHITLDYDKKEMMILWNKLMNDDPNRNLKLAQFKQIGQLLRHYYVCLQPNQPNLSFHWETLPIYFGLVFRFCQVSPQFHLEWAQSHNYRWAIGAMIWGTFKDHCPEVLPQLLKFTLTEFPVYREECWKSLPSPTTPGFAASFVQLARAMFEPNNEMAGRLFYRCNGLIWLTNIMSVADTAGNVLDPKEFYAVDALDVLHDYLTMIPNCLDKPYFAESFDHWQNLEDAIQLLTGNLMWNISYDVYIKSIGILQVIVQMGSPTQSAPVVAALDRAHVEWRNRYDAGQYEEQQLYELFGGSLSPFYQSRMLIGPEITPGVNFPPVRLGPSIFVPTALIRRNVAVSSPFGSTTPMATALSTLLKQWYEPYWALVKMACKLDGTKDLNSKSIELASLVLMEQVSIGQWSLLSVLCDAAQLAKTDSDMQLALQNPYVTLLMERLLQLEGLVAVPTTAGESQSQQHSQRPEMECMLLEGVSEQLWLQFDDLVRATVDNLDRPALTQAVKQAIDVAQRALDTIMQDTSDATGSRNVDEAGDEKMTDGEQVSKVEEEKEQAQQKEDAAMKEEEATGPETKDSSANDKRAAVVRNESQRLAKALQVLRLLSSASSEVMKEETMERWQQVLFSVLNCLHQVSEEYRTIVVEIVNNSKPMTPLHARKSGASAEQSTEHQGQSSGEAAKEGDGTEKKAKEEDSSILTEVTVQQEKEKSPTSDDASDENSRTRMMSMDEEDS